MFMTERQRYPRGSLYHVKRIPHHDKNEYRVPTLWSNQLGSTFATRVSWPLTAAKWRYNSCFVHLSALHTCVTECVCAQSTRGYLLERKSFQGATVFFLMSQTLANIYRSGLTAAGAVVVDALGPE